MKITVDYEELVRVLGFVNTVLSDKSVDDKMKNVIFLVKNDSVKVVGYNPLTFSRTELEKAEVEDVNEEGWVFQVKAAGLNKVLSSFSSLYKTEVSKLEFTEDGVKIRLTVFEEAKDEADSRLSQESSFLLENITILSNVLKEVNLKFPEDVSVLDSAELFLYIDSLYPLMSNESSSVNASKLNFADDYVFVLTGYMSSYFKNKLPDAFKDLTLSFSSVNFLKKLTSDVENIGVSKQEKYLCIDGGNTEAFLRYQKIKIRYKQYIEGMSKDLGIVVDRLYLKDVLKRMGNMSDTGRMSITNDGMLYVETDKFSQEIPLVNVKEGTSGVSFNVSIANLEKAIIGRDDSFFEDVFIYFVPSARGYRVYIKDKTGAWLSNIQVTKA